MQSGFLVFAFPAPPPCSTYYYEYGISRKSSIWVSGINLIPKDTEYSDLGQIRVRGTSLGLWSECLKSSQYYIELPYPRFFCPLEQKHLFCWNKNDGNCGSSMLIMKATQMKCSSQCHGAHRRKTEQCAIFSKWCCPVSFCREKQAWSKPFWSWDQLRRDIEVALNSLEW